MITIQGVTFYNINETAEMLCISPRKLSRWTMEGGKFKPEHIPLLPCVTSPKGKKIFKQEDIRKFASACFGVDIGIESLLRLPEILESISRRS
jgi:hypothetical protein